MSFYKGVVENNNDPLRLGRCKIRILGIHSHIKEKSKNEGITVDELPWANGANPITGSSTSGVGNFSIPVQGSWVWCFFEDENFQKPVYFATITGISQGVNSNTGFSDPDKKYPLYNNESDVSRLARNENMSDTIIPIKIKEQIKNITISSAVISGNNKDDFSVSKSNDIIVEPKEPYKTEYPYNKVIESEPGDYKNGHIIEMDDTPNAERLHIWHKSGTSTSTHWNGQQVAKVVADKYQISMKNDYTFIEGEEFKTIYGNQRYLVFNDSQNEIFGNQKFYVKKNKIEFISGNYALWIGADDIDNPEDPDYEILDKKNNYTQVGSLNELSTYYDNEKVNDIKYVPDTNTEENELEENEFSDLPTEDIGKGSWDIKVEGSINEEVKCTFYTEVTGAGTTDNSSSGIPGDYTIVPHGRFYIKGKNLCHIWGGGLQTEGGVITSNSICPFIMSPHIMGSYTVKATF